LRKRYSAVVLAYGAEGNRDLGLAGESELKGIHSAREFVNWYNGHPDSLTFGDHLPLSSTSSSSSSSSSERDSSVTRREVRHVVIIGQGNVALDCGRILSKDINELQSTDITTSALRRLQELEIERISLVGRRGYGQIACTIKELRELTRLTGVRVRIDLDEIERGKNESTRQEIVERRPLKRLTDLLLEIAEKSKGEGATDQSVRDEREKGEVSVKEKEKEKKKSVEMEFKFLLRPKELKGEGGFIKEIVFDRCELTGEAHRQTATPTGEEVTLPCDLLLTSVGYKTLPIDSEIPFNFQSHTIPHSQGRVVASPTVGTRSEGEWEGGGAKEGQLMKGIYVTGWCKRGPSGIIGTNISDAKETVGSVLQDLQSGELRSVEEEEAQEISNYLLTCKTSPSVAAVDRVVVWEDVLRLDRYERAVGQAMVPEKPREKCVSVEEMVLKMDQLKLAEISQGKGS
jgi:adrenodoxin-NADP+ reductase